MNFCLIAFLALILLACRPSCAHENWFSPVQKKQLENFIKQYIYENPELIVEAIQQMQSRQKAEEQARVLSALERNKKELEADPEAPVLGNPEADITIVEFFDYRCGYCKNVFANMVKVLEESSNVRFVLKEFPILGPESLIASRASLAVWRTHKDKYQAFHAALLKSRAGIPKAKIYDIATKLGIDTKQLKKDIIDPNIDRILNKNRRLAEDLNINGTPVFVVGNKIIPGALSLDAIRKIISAAGE